MTDIETSVSSETSEIISGENLLNICCASESKNKIQNNVISSLTDEKSNKEQLSPITNKETTINNNPDEQSNSANNLNQETIENVNSVIEQNVDEETNYESDNENICRMEAKTNKKRFTLIDSDSENEEQPKQNSTISAEEECEKTEHENISNDDQSKNRKSRLLKLCDSDSEEETKIISPKNIESTETITFETNLDMEQRNRLKKLCDSESSADENEITNEDSYHETAIKQKKSTNKSEPTKKKMTGREALEQRNEIMSESQKRLRESKISLPYHRPKQHTLQEFLKRRSIFGQIIKVPPNTPKALAIKMNVKQIEIVALELKKREKEIEEFYKSDSEAEDETEIKTAEENVNSNKENNEKNHLEQTNIDDTETTEKTIEQMEVETEEQSLTNKTIEENLVLELTETETSKTIPEVAESEESNERMCSNLEESEENKEAKLKEIKEILEKYLPNNSSNETTPETENVSEEIVLKASEEERKEKSPESSISKEVEMKKSPESLTSEESEKKKSTDPKLEQLKKLNPLIDLTNNFRPRLSGGPNELIIFDEKIEKSKRVNNLMHRFLLHTTKKHVQKKTEMSVVNVEHGIINKETIILTEEEKEETAKKIQIPGIRMKKLKMELQEQITQKRLQEWKKRQEEQIENEEENVYSGEKTDCEMNDKILDDEDEEAELTDTDPSSDEDEDEEEEIEEPEKRRVTSAFVDDEAEESDPEELEEDEDDDNNDEKSEEKENLESDKKSLRRIIKPFTEDSDDETISRSNSPCDLQRKMSIGASGNLSVSQTPSRNSNWEDIDEDIPAYQQQSEKTPCKITTQSKNDLTNFLTPTLHLTALQGMSSTKKSLQGSPSLNSFLPPEPSPLKSNRLIKTNLFSENVVENHLDELENICSGEFTAVNKNQNLSTQENQLLELCSGQFTGLTQIETVNSSLPIKSTMSLDLLSENSENFKLTIEEETDNLSIKKIEETEKNEFQVEEESSNTEKPLKYAKMVLLSSSEDENKENVSSTKKKQLTKKRRKYVIDDISISDEESDEERIKDDFDSDEEEIEDKVTENVDYDSEENEIILEKEETIKNPQKINDFFENEAELSGSEWGSADEDEKNLDDYEMEDGDDEKINEKKVQRELERMHVRNILDEDQREVKLLQEMLLEDGELHGAGRERKFRWKNADSLSWNTEAGGQNEEDEEFEDEESELQWRKMRYEREMFLKEQQNKTADEDIITSGSQIMKLGQAALRKSLLGSQSQHKTPVTEAISKNDDIKLPFTLVNKRGSFLSRSETTLARLAELTRTNGQLNNGPKNSRNFVFSTAEKTDASEEIITKKRKADEGTPKPLKKLRIADMSPNVQKRKRKLPMS